MNDYIKKLIWILGICIIANLLWLNSRYSGFDYGKKIEITFSYLGAVFGGTATLIALYITVNQTREIQKENQRQIRINNINEKIKDCTNLGEIFDKGNSLIRNASFYYNCKEKWMLEDLQKVSNIVDGLGNIIQTATRSPLISEMNIDIQLIGIQYDKITDLLEKRFLDENVDLDKEFKKLMIPLLEAINKINMYIYELYENKRKSN
jgi:hypothetical protein